MPGGEHDGSDRHHFFQEMKASVMELLHHAGPSSSWRRHFRRKAAPRLEILRQLSLRIAIAHEREPRHWRDYARRRRPLPRAGA